MSLSTAPATATPPSRPNNNFQISMDTMLKEAGTAFIGKKGRASVLALTGWHTDYVGDCFDFVIVRVATDKDRVENPKAIYVCMCDDGKELLATASFFCRADTYLERPDVAPAPFLDAVAAWRNLPANRASVRRAKVIAVRRLKQVADWSVLKDERWFTLDGNGENREGFYEALRWAGVPKDCWPTILTFECNAEVAFCNTLLFPGQIIFTGGDAAIRSNFMEEYIKRGSMGCLSDVRLLYLDYCGAPPKSTDMTAFLQLFPELLVYAVTISHRQHEGIHDDRVFETYVPTLSVFEPTRAEALPSKFNANGRVRCRVLERSKVLAVAVPGSFWNECPAKYRKTLFHGTIVEERPDGAVAAVVNEHGMTEVIFLNARSVSRYSVKKVPLSLKLKNRPAAENGNAARPEKTSRPTEAAEELPQAASKRQRVAPPLGELSSDLSSEPSSEDAATLLCELASERGAASDSDVAVVEEDPSPLPKASVSEPQQPPSISPEPAAISAEEAARQVAAEARLAAAEARLAAAEARVVVAELKARMAEDKQASLVGGSSF